MPDMSVTIRPSGDAYRLAREVIDALGQQCPGPGCGDERCADRACTAFEPHVTLQYIYDIRAAVDTLHRILVPGGVALVTVPGITRISTFDAGETGEYWHLTTWSARALFAERFPEPSVEVSSFGDVLTAAAALYGVATEDLRRRDLDHRDPTYQVLVAIRAVKEGR